MYDVKLLKDDYEIVTFGWCPIWTIVSHLYNCQTKSNFTCPEQMKFDIL